MGWLGWLLLTACVLGLLGINVAYITRYDRLSAAVDRLIARVVCASS